MLELLRQPWHWAFSGTLIAMTMFVLLYWGRSFGVSSTLRTVCAIGGAGKKFDFFDIEWKDQIWNLLFVAGAIIGGFIGSTLLASPEPVAISQETIQHLQGWGIDYPATTEEGTGYLPNELFSFQNLLTPRGLLLMIGGGFLVGFGARYAGGCTSGHAISGLSNLQVPSLITVIGFFIGGLIMTHFLLPLILS